MNNSVIIKHQGELMLKLYTKSFFLFVIVMLISVIKIGCSSKSFDENPFDHYYEESTTVTDKSKNPDQDQNSVTEQPEKDVASAISLGTSIFTVIEIEDLEYPTLETSIQLPFSANSNNTVVLAEKHAYVTTERHIHVIDISMPIRPSYLTSMAFPDGIGKAILCKQYLVIASGKKFHIINISNPSEPALESTTHLPGRNAIKDMDVRGAYLYVLGKDNYSLYIFSTDFVNPRLVRTYKLAKRWQFLSPYPDSPKVKQFQVPSAGDGFSSLHEPLLSQRGFLQLHCNPLGITRSSNEFLVSNDTVSKANDFISGRELHKHRKKPGSLFIIDACWIDEVRKKMRIGVADIYSMRYKYEKDILKTRKKIYMREKPTSTYVVQSGKMKQIIPNQVSETVEVDSKTYEGSITDFQISENLVYIINEKGFFTIFQSVYIDDRVNINGKVLSTTPLQASHPISLAVGKNHAYILSSPAKLQR